MKKISQEDFDRLLNQFRALSNERLEIENELLKVYEVLNVKNISTIPSEKFKTITSLRERLKIVKKEIKKIDQKILKMLKIS